MLWPKKIYFYHPGNYISFTSISFKVYPTTPLPNPTLPIHVLYRQTDTCGEKRNLSVHAFILNRNFSNLCPLDLKFSYPREL